MMIGFGRCIPLAHLQPSNPRKGPIVSVGYSMKPPAAFKRATMRADSGQSAQQDHGRSKFLEVYDTLKSELLHDPAFDFTNESRRWVHDMLDYTVPVGRLACLSLVTRSYQQLQQGNNLSDKDNFYASVLGWCVQWYLASVLVADDILDNSYTRWGRPCRFRLPEVGMIATNDAILLQAQIFRILKKHFGEKPYYVQLLDLFNQVAFQTSCGQMLDVITAREKDLSKYSMELYSSIAKYKGTYLSTYLPVSVVLYALLLLIIMAGERLEDHFEFEDILVKITTYAQIQDDYQDCFGDENMTGKAGTDIADGKCSWLILKALELANEDQKKILYENYGKAAPACVAKVKETYAHLDLQNICKQYHRRSFEELKKSAESHPSKVVQPIWETMNEIFSRI